MIVLNLEVGEGEEDHHRLVEGDIRLLISLSSLLDCNTSLCKTALCLTTCLNLPPA
jgi:hypothetical protein